MRTDVGTAMQYVAGVQRRLTTVQLQLAHDDLDLLDISLDAAISDLREAQRCIEQARQ